MTNTVNKDLNLVPFVSVDDMMKIILELGVEEMMLGICEYLEDDFKRWELFDKTPRVASHSQEGVIELMPTSDGEVYGFKYVNGHPKKYSRWFANCNSLWCSFRCEHGIPGFIH